MRTEVGRQALRDALDGRHLAIGLRPARRVGYAIPMEACVWPTARGGGLLADSDACRSLGVRRVIGVGLAAIEWMLYPGGEFRFFGAPGVGGSGEGKGALPLYLVGGV